MLWCTSAFCARCRSAWSISTSASIASAIGVARMPTQGSWRPWVSTTVGAPERGRSSGAAVRMLERRLDRDRDLDVLPGRDAAEHAAGVVADGSLRASARRHARVPRCVTRAKPAPISTPLTALMPIIAYAMSASSLSNSGSPSPAAPSCATTRSAAPTESPALRSSSMSCLELRNDRSHRARRTGCSSTSAQRRTGSRCRRSAACSRAPGCRSCSRSHFLATAPAATIGAVSRADERPPPRGSRRPYLRQ